MPVPLPAIYDLKRLFALREAVETLDVSAPPAVRLISPQTVTPLRRVGILCGSFNPLTFAHTTLAEKASETFGLDCVFFTLAKVTVDKEQVTGLGLEDRLLLLSLYTEQHAKLGVALVNRGLYFEQAQAFRAVFGDHTTISFLIGMDKLLQIFDPRYYQDRDTALQQLFALASLMVANRGDMDEQSFVQLLDRPENRPFREHVRFFTLPETIADLSATQVRQSLTAAQPVSTYVPPEVETFICETRAYHPPLQCDDEQIDVYTVRQALLTLLYTERSWAEQTVDFRRLLIRALSSDTQGHTLRHISDSKSLAPLARVFSLKPKA
jgi:nicotinamide-nucleotide adenylyltransferase